MPKRPNQLRQIIRIDTELNKIQDLDILLERILLEARVAVNADAGTIYIKEGTQIEFRYTQNDTMEAKLPAGQKLIYSVFKANINTSTISGYVAATGKVLRIANMYKIPKDRPFSFNPSYDNISGYKTVSTLTIPLRTNNREILGVLQLINKKTSDGKIVPFSKTDSLFGAHFASNATLALQRAQMTRTIILRMISMAEFRDPTETGPHVNRVAAVSVALYERWAERKQISLVEIERMRDILRMAAMLHDVGKVAISDTLLLKPAQLTEDEHEAMKTHTFLGARLFRDTQSEFDEIAQQVALNHHENWDGTGYPGHLDDGALDPSVPFHMVKYGKGKKGEEIPIYGRIVAVADVYDALASERRYKEAWEEERIIREMKSLSGKQFDPELIDVFLEIFPQLKQISSRFPG